MIEYLLYVLPFVLPVTMAIVMWFHKPKSDQFEQYKNLPDLRYHKSINLQIWGQPIPLVEDLPSTGCYRP